MNAAGSGTTVLGRSVKIRGEFSGAEDLVLEGDFEGTIQNPGASVTIGEHARVRAGIAARDVVVHGRVEGEIHATGSVKLFGQATVVGNIFASRFALDEGSSFRGRVDPTRAAEPLPNSVSSFAAGSSGLSSESHAGQTRIVPELLVLVAPEPIAVQPALFGAGAPVEEQPKYGHLPAGLAAAWRKMDSGITPAASEPLDGERPKGPA
jgi:cytoskeletal protein CcmA (bactofilin family)